MKRLKRSILPVLAFLLLFSCFEDADDNFSTSGNVKDFVWRGLNAFYLYKDIQPDLADDRFSSNQDYTNFLADYTSPEDLFDHLTVSEDRFSFLVNDYIALEQYLSGTSVSNGMEYTLYRKPQNQAEVFGIVTYVLPNTDADSKNITRGIMFDQVNGTPLYYNSATDNNLGILNQTSYSITIATLDDSSTPDIPDDDSVNTTTETIALSKAPYTENPIFKTEVIPTNSGNVGYLMYNGFTADFDAQLNQAFATFQSANVTDFVLDLRYNPGGSVNSAILLSSMITGQFTGDVFLTRQWNSQIQDYLETEDPEALINRFTNQFNGGSLNSLNLDKVYILTSENTASASELVINCLTPYINVVQVGDYTTGKYQASITLYDSPDFGRSGANPSHLYALQPLVFKSLNANGYTDYDNGLAPDIEVIENYRDFGVLGDVNEPLLAAALADIESGNRMIAPGFSKTNAPKKLGDSKQRSPLKNRMYVTDENLPIIK